MVAHRILDRPLELRLLLAVPLSVACLLLASACGGGGGSSTPPAVTAPDLTAPSITASPAPVTITAGGTATFTVAASGSALTYQWQVNTGSGYSNVSDGGVYSGSATATLTVTGATAGMTGYTYECVVSGSVTPPAISTAATLTVNSAPAITTQPGPQTITNGSAATFTVAAAGTSLTYQWQVSTDGVTFTNLADTSFYSGSATSTLAIKGATLAMNGYLYQCVVSGTVAPPVTSSAALLTVTAVGVPASITTQPGPQTITNGSAATFTVVAAGSGLTYQWKVSSTLAGSYTNVTGAGYSGATTATLGITAAAAPALTGNYYECVVAGTVGSVTTNPVLLTVNNPASIVTQPVPATVTNPNNAIFAVTASGTGITTSSSSFQWKVSTTGATGTYSNVGTGVSTSAVNGITNTLTVTAPGASANGSYYECVITGSAGAPITTTPALLTVNIAAGIVVQPVAATVTNPANAIFAVTASGTGITTSSSSFLWKVSTTGVNGTYSNAGAGVSTTAANGITNTLTVSAPPVGTAYYECVITGTFGSPVTTNPPVLLTVDSLPNITSFTTNKWSVPAGGQVTFTAVFTNGSDNGRSAIISPGNIDISSGTASATPSTPTTYTLVVKNSAGTPAATSPTLHIVAGSLASVAGTPGGYGEIDGSGTNARFSFPAGIVYDSTRSSLYVVDQGYGSLGGTLRVLSALGTTAGASTVGTFAGMAGMDRSTLPSNTSIPLLNDPYAVAADGFGNLFVADTNNSCIRMVDHTGAITTVVGRPGTSGDAFTLDSTSGIDFWGLFNQPYGVAVNMTSSGNGTIYIADSGNNKIKTATLSGGTVSAMSVLAGTGAAGSTNGAGINGTDVAFNYPIGISVDAANAYLYVADADNESVRKVATLTGATTTPVSSGLVDPLDVLDVTIGGQEYVIVTDTGHNQIKAYRPDGTSERTISSGTFINPTHVASNGTDLFVSDSGNNAIRRIIDPFGAATVVTLAGLTGNPGNAEGSGVSASFSNPGNIAVDANGLVYVADRANALIRTVTGAGLTTLYAGIPGSVGHDDNVPRLSATFKSPEGVAVDTLGNVFVADTGNNCVRIIDASGTVATIADSVTNLNVVKDPVAVVSGGVGVLYVADNGIPGVLKLTTTDPSPSATSSWTATIFAGQLGVQGWADGAGLTAAEFYTPGGIAYDSVHQIVYVADAGSNNIRAIAADGTVSTLAGDQEAKPLPGSIDGIGSAARFNNPQSVAYDAGYLYVADTNNGTVRRIDTTTGEVHTIVGLVSRSLQDTLGGLPAAAVTQGIAVDPSSGLVYLSTNDAIMSFPF